MLSWWGVEKMSEYEFKIREKPFYLLNVELILENKL
jgi:hypothetical protein